MASITIRNLDAEIAAAVKCHAAECGRTLAEELHFLADNAGIVETTAANNNRSPKRKLTTAEKLAIADRAHSMQTRVLPCGAPLIRQLRQEWAANVEAKLCASPLKMTEEDERYMREARARARRARKRK